MKIKKDNVSSFDKSTAKKCYRRVFAVVFCCMLTIIPISAQTGNIKLSIRNASISEMFSAIEKQSKYRFSYRDADIDGSKRITVSVNNEPLKNFLTRELSKCNLSFMVSGNKIIVVPAKEKKVYASENNGETKRITGVVTDSKGEPVIGASVFEKGTKNGTVTDIDGNYSLNVSDNSEVEISYIGFANQNIKVRGNSNFNFVLKEDAQTMEEVVVVGYGQQKKANLTGSVTTVKMDDVLGSRPLTKASDALLGAAPGLLASSNGNSPGSSRSFQMRGAYSIGSESTISPLVLIDNVEGSLDMMNPEDIESITVLKDAASAAIYGARAAGGVILITSKHPKSNSTFKLNYNNNIAFSSAVNLPKQASLTQYLDAYNDCCGDQFWTLGSPSVSRWKELLGQYNKDRSSLQTYGDGIYKDTDGAVYYLNEKDLVKNMLETGIQQTHNLSASGGTKDIRYRLSAGYANQDGALITNKDQFVRKNISGFISADVTKWFTQEATLSYSHRTTSLPSSSLGAIYSTRLGSFYPEGNMPAEIEEQSAGYPFFTPANQIRWSNTSKDKNSNSRIFLKSILRPIKNLEVDFEYTYDRKDYDYYYYTGKTDYTTVQGSVNTTPTNDYLQKQKSTTTYNALNVYGTYRFSLAENNFKLMAGFNQESSRYDQMTATSYGQSVVEVPSLGGGTSTLTANDSYSEYAIRGGFFRVNYDYQGKYLFEVNGRYDGSSKFPKKNRFGFFPSVSAGWNIAEENFMKTTRSWLDGLKLRASYGMIGNQNISPYTFIPTMAISNKYSGWLVDGAYTTAITSLPNLVSNNFTWEKAKTLDFGVDIVMLNNRFTTTFDWYQRNTDGMLAPGMQLPAVVGASAPYQNTADMRTRGWDLSMNWRDKIGKVGYRIGLNLWDYSSKITKYDSNESKLLSSYYEGEELGEIWGYVYDGFYSVDDFEDTKTWKLKDGISKPDGTNPRPGDVKFVNLRDDDQGTNIITSGDNTLENPGDRKRIGNSLPRYLFGITLGANYMGFDLNVFLQGVGKRDAWLANTLTLPLYSDYKFIPLYEDLSNYWKPVDAANGDYTCANPNAEYARIYGNYGNQGSNYRVSDKYLSDASYLRVKNVTLSYTFPTVLVKRLSLSQLRLSVSVENLFTFSSLKNGIDPETLSWNYPSYRTFSFGINVTL